MWPGPCSKRAVPIFEVFEANINYRIKSSTFPALNRAINQTSEHT